jgi:hypothetical protein
MQMPAPCVVVPIPHAEDEPDVKFKKVLLAPAPRTVISDFPLNVMPGDPIV